jgi:hypothetical protein
VGKYATSCDVLSQTTFLRGRSPPHGGRLCTCQPTIELLTTVNNKGQTPMIICCKAGACRKSLTPLLQHGAAVTMSDHEGLTPFLGLFNRYTMIKRVPALRNQWSELGDIKKEDLVISRDFSDSSHNSVLGPVELLSCCKILTVRHRPRRANRSRHNKIGQGR